jgi:hypothetical protein
MELAFSILRTPGMKVLWSGQTGRWYDTKSFGDGKGETIFELSTNVIVVDNRQRQFFNFIHFAAFWVGLACDVTTAM